MTTAVEHDRGMAHIALIRALEAALDQQVFLVSVWKDDPLHGCLHDQDPGYDSSSKAIDATIQCVRLSRVLRGFYLGQNRTAYPGGLGRS